MFDVILTVRDLHKSFNGYRAVNGVDFSVKPGEVLGLAGPNGSGKSTVLNLITGIIRADRGEIFFQGKSLVGLPPEKIVHMGVARTFQLARPFLNMNVGENVLVALTAGRSRANRRDFDKIEEILGATGLLEKKDWNTGRLSSGALRRLEVARALATEPRLLLLDEPFATLSLKEEAGLLKLLNDLNGSGVTLLLVSHRPRILREVTHRVLIFDSGRVKMEVKPEEVNLVSQEGVEL